MRSAGATYEVGICEDIVATRMVGWYRPQGQTQAIEFWVADGQRDIVSGSTVVIGTAPSGFDTIIWEAPDSFENSTVGLEIEMLDGEIWSSGNFWSRLAPDDWRAQDGSVREDAC